ncbi:extradiol ring-cleavage dioxygenase [Effusibacillus lacus]|uniref:Extradiol ring-cleavage dioxygenase n=1 Tax=Effusibacillus lacus TaxID=1348429 RepID=A0A292YN95_9BACL|nr:extradiol ring-cleavage dioxygenase [Effusibacillus lacus]TCS76603.1 3,4-dihydroxyphenylacetate 2,3-dioxygenase [Effusibacillus lacus]GAX90381.1 extradiol ring-cleavage dioxygenase [Effusibacillus lacus]
MTIEMGVLTTHVPRICHEDHVADFQKPMVQAMKEVSKTIYSIQPDVLVIVSCHWNSTFHHFVDTTQRHKGILTAFECPELISDVPYNYPGDEQLGKQLVEAGKKAGLPVIEVNDPTYVWDYGTVVPLRYLVPNEDIPIIDLSVVWAASLDETYTWGQQIGKVLRESDKHAVFVSSGALSHNLVRGPELMPTLSEQALDKQFTEYLINGDFTSARNMLPQYARAAGVESGGRHLAMLLGVLEGDYRGNFLAYGQSSGSGNVVMTFQA